MKVEVLLLMIVMCGFLASCNMGKDKNKDIILVGTDTSMTNNSSNISTQINTKIDSGSVINSDTIKIKNTQITKSTATNTDTASSNIFAKPNLAKKGKKGSIKIEANKITTGNDFSADKEGYHSNVEVLPVFPGGQRALESFFDKNIQYPVEASDNGVEGIVKIVFSVDESGKVSSPKVVSQNIGYGIEKEAMRVFAKMPIWTAGKINGKNVKTKYTLPVNFRID